MEYRCIVREKMRAKITAFSEESYLLSSKSAADHLSQTKIFSESHHIACYYSKRTEVKTQAVIQAIWKAKKVCYLPIVQPKTKQLIFVSYFPEDRLIQNKFGIHEPIFSEEKKIDPSHLDLVIAPLIAFDQEGNRIGSGGGCYDRTFSFLGNNSSIKKPFLYGLGFSFQSVPAIETIPTDVRLHGVITEKGSKRMKREE